MSDFMTFIQDLLLVIVTCATPVVATYLVKLLDTKRTQIKVGIVDANLKDAFDKAVDIIEDCTEKTAQIYVDELKKAGKFDKTSQKKALQMSIDSIKELLTEDEVYAIKKIAGDLEKFLVTKIEASVRKTKLNRYYGA